MLVELGVVEQRYQAVLEDPDQEVFVQRRVPARRGVHQIATRWLGAAIR